MTHETEHNGVVAVEAAETKQESFHILPCPVCGADEASTYLGDPGPGVVRCFAVGCDAVVSGYATDCEAIEEWNRRSAAMTNGRCASDELTECFRHHIAEAIGWQAFGFRPGREMQMYEEGFKAGYRRRQSDNEAELGEADAVDIPASLQPMTDHKDARQLLADITPSTWRFQWDFQVSDWNYIDGSEAEEAAKKMADYGYEMQPLYGVSSLQAIADLVAAQDRRIASLEDALQSQAPEKFDIKEYISEYEFCGDGGDHVPTDFERALIEDAVYGCAHHMGEEHQATIAALSQRIAELEAARQWQPIETADKDAPFLLLGVVRNGVLLATHIGTFCYAVNEDEESCWWSLQDDDEISPTHWMPLPASPDGAQ